MFFGYAVSICGDLFQRPFQLYSHDGSMTIVSVWDFVGLSVCLSVIVREDISGITCPNFTKFFPHVVCCHGSVLIGSIAICYVLLILLIDVIFSHNLGPLMLRMYIYNLDIRSLTIEN